jgi:hypothetical protein
VALIGNTNNVTDNTNRVTNNITDNRNSGERWRVTNNYRVTDNEARELLSVISLHHPHPLGRGRRAGFFSRHRQPGMGSDPIDSIFLGGEFTKVMHGTIWPYYLHAPNRAFPHRR